MKPYNNIPSMKSSNIVKDSSSNPSFINFQGTAKDIDNQILSPGVGNIAHILKNFTIIEQIEILSDTISIENGFIIQNNQE